MNDRMDNLRFHFPFSGWNTNEKWIWVLARWGGRVRRIDTYPNGCTLRWIRNTRGGSVEVSLIPEHSQGKPALVANVCFLFRPLPNDPPMNSTAKVGGFFRHGEPSKQKTRLDMSVFICGVRLQLVLSADIAPRVGYLLEDRG